MSRANIARLWWVLIIGLLGVVAWQVSKVSTSPASFRLSELNKAVESHLSASQSAKGTLEKLSVRENEGKMEVDVVYVGDYLGNQVKATATIKGNLSYAAMRKHFLFSSHNIRVTNLEILGKASGDSVAVNRDNRRRGNSGLEVDIADAISKAFSLINVREISEEVSPNAYLNKVTVKGDEVTLSWDKMQTTTTTIMVIIVILLLIVILCYCPEILFFWAIFT